ncbi:MAG: hypothetical protein ACFE0Q_08755 [Anaerolineae bacterium]
MSSRPLTALLFIFGIIALMIVAVLAFAPDSTGISPLNPNTTDNPACLTDIDGQCITLPDVSGLNINSAEVRFPADFDADYQLLVMPFDREQQVLAVTWLPLFQELQADYPDTLDYWSIAALPALNPGVRLLVLGGVSAAISDATIRPQVTALFLDEQEAFLDALGITDSTQIQVLIVDQAGTVYYREIGEYTAEAGASLREAVERLLG